MASGTPRKYSAEQLRELAQIPPRLWKRLVKRASFLKSLGSGAVNDQQVRRVAAALKVSRATVYRWHQRFREARTVTALVPRKGGFPARSTRLHRDQERIITDVFNTLRRHGKTLRVVDVMAQIEQACKAKRVTPPSRRSVDRRLKRETPFPIERRNAPAHTHPPIAPGQYQVRRALDVVQIDHTQVDCFVVDELHRYTIGRPHLTLAIDVATRAVLGMVVTLDKPSATSVALCLSQVVAPKRAWLESLGIDLDWPMAGMPRSLHMDNGAEFHSKALERGCAQFGIELIYRPPARPHFGGHVERAIGTLMHRLRTLPGATGSSIQGRKARKPEKTAKLTLRELETWLVLEVAGRYHMGAHRGLNGGSPLGAWQARPPVAVREHRRREVLMAFLPAALRTVRRDGVHFNNIRYWHPIFANWALRRKKLLVHFDPRDLSRLYAIGEGGEYLEIGYADVRHPPVSLWEYRAAARYLRQVSREQLDEHALFKAIEQQRAVLKRAHAATRRAREVKFPSRRERVSQRREDHDSVTTPAINLDDLTPYGAEVWP